jgi:hypothetical protein
MNQLKYLLKKQNHDVLENFIIDEDNGTEYIKYIIEPSEILKEFF